MPLLSVFDVSSEVRLYVSTEYNEPSFRELRNEYWLPNAGRLAFHRSGTAARDDAAEPSVLQSSIYLSNVTFHTKTSYEHFYAGLGQSPPAQIAFDRPALVLREHEAEDPRWRDGAGFTTASVAVCLPKMVRDRIGAELHARPQNRWIVVGFPHAQFVLPQPRDILPKSGFIGRVWVIETDAVAIDVF